MHTARLFLGTAILAGTVFVPGCGTPGAPQPPSLNLPDKVTNLAAIREGDHVTLTWSMPKRNTDKVMLKGILAVHVCRSLGSGPCEQAGELSVAPGLSTSFVDVLPAALKSGAPRPLSYFVELRNRNGRSAGLSNPAVVLAGQSPAPVAGLTTELRRDGVVLHWTADANGAIVRLHRKLLTPPASKPQEGPLTAAPAPVDQDLEMDSDSGLALDKSVTFGMKYAYRAQRIARVAVDGKSIELPGEISAPVEIEARNVFPPLPPEGLVAVATAAGAGTEASIDLNWQPSSEPEVAGYVVYRREAAGEWQRVSPARPLVGSAYHDAQVQPGHTYEYAVSAVDRAGRESQRSREAQDTVPTP